MSKHHQAHAAPVTPELVEPSAPPAPVAPQEAATEPEPAPAEPQRAAPAASPKKPRDLVTCMVTHGLIHRDGDTFGPDQLVRNVAYQEASSWASFGIARIVDET